MLNAICALAYENFGSVYAKILNVIKHTSPKIFVCVEQVN
jgi:hypothetical protein